MKSIPRLVAGTAVVLAAVLTTAPVTAGIADFVLNPEQQPVKRAAPALTGHRTPPVGPAGTRDDRDENRDQTSPSSTDTRPGAGADSSTTLAFSTSAQQGSTSDQQHPDSDRQRPTSDRSTLGETAGLVAHTAADAESRVTDLAGDLQSGVEAGEFSQADANRVLEDLSSYIRGERTWPERTVA